MASIHPLLTLEKLRKFWVRRETNKLMRNVAMVGRPFYGRTGRTVQFIQRGDNGQYRMVSFIVERSRTRRKDEVNYAIGPWLDTRPPITDVRDNSEGSKAARRFGSGKPGVSLATDFDDCDEE